MSLAIVIVSCDKYSWLWDAWYHYFQTLHLDVPVYFINESTELGIDGITQIKVPSEGVDEWTKMVREGVEQIPEKHLFILLEDFFIQEDITGLIESAYDIFMDVGADALRIMAEKNRHCTESLTDLRVGGYSVSELTDKSAYKISFSPNIWKKSFLLRCLAVDESPWDAEINGSKRVRGAYLLSMEIIGWYAGVMHKGKLTPDGKRLIEKI